MDRQIETIKLDVSHASSTLSLHEMLAAAFQFPSYYGRNWDAFWDCIRDPNQSRMPKHIVIVGMDLLEKKLPEASAKLRNILSESQVENPSEFIVTYEERELP